MKKNIDRHLLKDEFATTSWISCFDVIQIQKISVQLIRQQKIDIIHHDFEISQEWSQLFFQHDMIILISRRHRRFEMKNLINVTMRSMLSMREININQILDTFLVLVLIVSEKSSSIISKLRLRRSIHHRFSIRKEQISRLFRTKTLFAVSKNIAIDVLRAE
jgi:hypothetical protein